MQAMTAKDIEQIARLARLGLTQAEAEEYAVELNSVRRFRERLAGCETQGVAPTFYARAGESRLRADESRPSMPQKLVLKHAPDRYEDFFRVPRMMED